MPALLFGSISSIADTSEIQRAAFNRAFAEHGLDWSWDQQEYRELLTGNGGVQRIADQAAARGEDVDATAVHATKSSLFQQTVTTEGTTVRPGVAEAVAQAKERGIRVALVTTTSPENVAAVFAGLGDALRKEDFELLVSSAQVETSKPDPAVYAYALEQLGEQAADCVAVEDNVGGVSSAKAAGLECIAFPNENTAGHDFAQADRVVDRIDLSASTTLR